MVFVRVVVVFVVMPMVKGHACSGHGRCKGLGHCGAHSSRGGCVGVAVGEAVLR